MAALAMDTTSDPEWYKDAIIYQLHVKSFCDSNGDGVGDFPGLISKLDYLVDLGVNAIWLLPFYPSPRRDDGYDISDYRNVHPDYGTLADVRKLVRAAHARGLHVITELVINHTSDQHVWFQRARRAPPGSARRNYYVWSDSDQRYAGTRVIFCDTEASNWTWDEVAGAYYWHRFYSHQPDLNFDNPAVLREVLGAMRFWLAMGIDGLRLDAVPYLVEREGTNNENLPETHAILKRLRAAMDAAFPGRMLIAEANQWPEDVQEYFGNGDECHMAFHFPVMPRMYMAIAREDRFPITDILRQTPQIPESCQWAIFLRNHDELTLEMVTSAERDYLWDAYAMDRRARINLGIRRRLSPLLQRDRHRIELMNSLLLSLPGTPVIYYGDEIGMGDNIHLGDRDGVRTPMQWRPDRNGGFSSADPEQLVLPALMDPLYGYATVNVEAQARDPSSLLNWSRRMLGLRRQHRAFGRGRFEFLYPGNRKVLAYLRTTEAETILCVANLSHAPQAVELDLAAWEGYVPVELTAGSSFPPIGKLTYLLTLSPHGFYWFLLSADAEPPQWRITPPELMPEYTTLVMHHGNNSLDSADIRKRLEDECLLPYLRMRRWFGAKQAHAGRPTLGASIVDTESGVRFAEVMIPVEGAEQRYLLPMVVVWDNETPTALEQQLAIARVRRGSRVGMLTDAFSVPAFAPRILSLMRASARIEDTEGGVLRFRSTSALARVPWPNEADVRWLTAEQSNSSLVIGEHAVLKLLRRCRTGVQPEQEMAAFLTARGFTHTPQLLGDVVRQHPDSSEVTYAVLLDFVRNQGDGWGWTQDLLARLVNEHVVDRASEDNDFDALLDQETFTHAVGLRLGQLHAVLAHPSEDPAFAPQPIEARDLADWSARCTRWLRRAGDALATLVQRGDSQLDALVTDVLERIEQRLALADATPADGGGVKTRVHGDFHLGQVLVVNGDAWLIDFEGAPALPLEERRALQSPLVDVAGMLRSIEYAAATALRNELAQMSPALEQRRRELLASFAIHGRRQFLQGYHEGGGATLDPALLQLFMLEKAAYEICYELNNRPSWLDVPLRGMRNLLEQPDAGGMA